MADTIELNTLGDVIKEAYEGQPDTNAFDDAARDKLTGIAAQATKNVADDILLSRENHTGTQVSSTIVDLPDLLADKQDAIPGKVLTDANFTQAEKDKLAGLEDAHFKGVHVGLSGLTDAHPTGAAGDYAVVDDGVDLTWYQWDASVPGWVARVGESTEITPAQVKDYYEENPDTNAFTDDEKAALAALTSSGRFTFRRLGTWNAATNDPELLNGTGANGDFYVVTTAGTYDFGVGEYAFRERDWVVFAGGTWQRLTTVDQQVTWGQVTSKPAVYVPRGTISPPIPAMRARMPFAQLIQPTTITTLTGVTTAVYDYFSMLSGSTITIPAWASHARILCNLRSGHIMEGRHLWGAIRINGATQAAAKSFGSGSITNPVISIDTGIVPVASGDLTTVSVYHNDPAAKNIGSGIDCFISIELFEAL